jgi:hypothetical protein
VVYTRIRKGTKRKGPRPAGLDFALFITSSEPLALSLLSPPPVSLSPFQHNHLSFFLHDNSL